MPLDSPSRVHTPFAPVVVLPPPFRVVSLREVGDAFAHAKRIAADSGAGTLVHVGRFDLAEFAVVLEPDEPLRSARRAIYAGLAALGDALAAYAPPEKPINFDWPGGIRIDGGLVGGARLAWPSGAEEDSPPPWLVFGAMIRTAAMDNEEPGLRPLAAALDAEGFDLGAGRLLESFARHFMVTLHAWQQDGFSEIGKRYLSRLTPEKHVHRAIDSNGDLLVRGFAGAADEHRALVPALAVPTWFDPASGAPRL
jgi:biotin-(acetyl-CoA carboxylase) ligase